MKKKIGLATLALSVVTTLAPVTASARDRDDYRGSNTERETRYTPARRGFEDTRFHDIGERARFERDRNERDRNERDRRVRDRDGRYEGGFQGDRDGRR